MKTTPLHWKKQLIILVETHQNFRLCRSQSKTTRLPVLDLRNVSVRYRTFHKQTKDALHQVSTTFYKGDQVALVGNNGAGKSSLLKVLGGIVKPTEGVMELSETIEKIYT